MAGVPAATTRSSSPHRCSCTTPVRMSAWVDNVSEPEAARSSSATRRPARARSMAVAAPAQRAPTTTTSYSDGDDIDRHRDSVGDHVEHRRAGLRLGHELAHLLLAGVGVDAEADPDLLVAVADLAGQAEDALQ